MSLTTTSLDPPLARMSSTVELDRTNSTYHGIHDSIRGTASVVFEPAGGYNDKVREFFGRLVVHVVLEGELQARVWVDRGSTETTILKSYTEKRRLFRRQVCLHDAEVRLYTADALSWSFEVGFPEYADPRPRRGDDESTSVPQQPLEGLPASFKARLNGSLQNRGDVNVVYRILILAEMPGWSAHLRVQRPILKDICYLPPNWQGVQETRSLAQNFNITSRHLIISSNKAKGKGKSTFKSFFGSLLDKDDESMPRLAFVLLLSGFPAYTVRSSASSRELSFQVNVFPQWEFSSITEVPEMVLKSVKIQLWAITAIYAVDVQSGEMQKFCGKEKVMKDDVQVQRVEPPGPFAVVDGLEVKSEHSGTSYRDRGARDLAISAQSSDTRDESPPRYSAATSAQRLIDDKPSPPSTPNNDTEVVSVNTERAKLEQRMAHLRQNTTKNLWRPTPRVLYDASQTSSSSSSKHPSRVETPPGNIILVKRITTMPIDPVLPTFSTSNLSRKYELSVQVELSVGKQTVGMTRTVPLVVYSNEPEHHIVEERVVEPVEGAGHEQLPAYEEVMKQ